MGVRVKAKYGWSQKVLNECSCPLRVPSRVLSSQPLLPSHRWCLTADGGCPLLTEQPALFLSGKRKKEWHLEGVAGSRREFILGWEDLNMFVDWRENEPKDGRNDGEKWRWYKRLREVEMLPYYTFIYSTKQLGSYCKPGTVLGVRIHTSK